MIDRPDQTELQVCYFGTYRADYTRNQILINGLRSQGVQVHECHVQFWRGIDDRIQLGSGGWRNPRFWWRVIATYARLIREYVRAGSYDVMLIGYPGQFDTYLGRLLTWWHRKPLVLDILMSLHLVAEERGLTKTSPITGHLLFFLEKVALKLPDFLIAETAEYQQYYCDKYRLNARRFLRVPHGANDRVFKPRLKIPASDGRFHLVYHGTFVPSHGAETIVRAAAELREYTDIHFSFYGEGQEKSRINDLAQKLSLDNITFFGWVAENELLDALGQADAVLGIFGTTKQAYCTVQNKVWEGLSMRRPVITGDAPTLRHFLTHKKHVYLVKRADPGALAKAILALRADPNQCDRIAINGYEHYMKYHSVTAIGLQIKEALMQVKIGN